MGNLDVFYVTCGECGVRWPLGEPRRVGDCWMCPPCADKALTVVGYCWTCNEFRHEHETKLMETPTGDYRLCNTCIMPVDPGRVTPF